MQVYDTANRLAQEIRDSEEFKLYKKKEKKKKTEDDGGFCSVIDSFGDRWCSGTDYIRQ